MRSLRRFLMAAALGAQQARHGGARTALVLFGVAAAGALLAAVLVGSAAAERRALDRSIEQLSPATRVVRVAWFGIPAQAEPYAVLDRAARGSLQRILQRPSTGTVLFRESTIGGSFVALGAVDHLSRWVRVTEGRLPRSCKPQRCEVIQLRGSGRAPRGFAVVGRGRLLTAALFGDAIPAERNELGRVQLAPSLQRTERYHQPSAPPLLLADGVRSLAALPTLESSYRSYGWVVTLEPGDLTPQRVDGVVSAASRARAFLQATSGGFELAAPVAELQTAADRAEIGARRLLLLGGQAAALLLAFAAFASTRLRRSAQEADRRLSLLGVSLWLRVTTTGTHAAVLASVGVAASWATAAVAIATVDADLAKAALLTLDGVAAACALSLAAGACVAVGFAARAPALEGRFSWLDAVALALIVAVGAALTRGAADADALLREDGSGVFLFALPAAVVVIAAVVTARLLAPAVRRLERVIPESAIAPRLAALSIARRPGGAAAAAAFLTISVSIAIFASAYRATLDRGQRDQAAFALGADLVLREDLRRLVPVRNVVSQALLEGLGSEVSAAPVARAAANVASVGTLSGIAVLGLEPPLLESLRGLELDAPELEVPAELKGPRLPRAGRSLTIGGRTSKSGVTLSLVVRGPGGAYERIVVTVPGRAAVPAAARGGTLLGFQVLPPPRLQERGADAGRPFVAEIELGPVRAGGSTIVDEYRGWVGLGGASYRTGRLSVTLSNQVETWFRPRQRLDTVPLPAIVSPPVAAVADDSRRLTLQLGGRPVRVEVVAIETRFPSTRGDFAVVDRAALESALNLTAPGSGFPTEVWANATTPAAEEAARARLRRPPFGALVLDSRVEREEALHEDPLARGALGMLVLAAAAALLLALLAVALSTLADLRDDRQELLDLESQGAPPALLRRLVRLRQLGACVLGLIGGVLTGALLARLVVEVVSVSAGGEPPVPPLRLTFDPQLAAAALALLGAAAALVVLLATGRVFRTGAAGRPDEVES